MGSKRESTAPERVTQSAEGSGAEANETSSPSKKRAKISYQHISQLASDEFSSKITLFDGPKVAITVGDIPKKIYHLPKALLVNTSRYFAAVFDGGFIEGIEHKIELDCTITAFDFLVQSLYTGSFNAPIFPTPFQEISALLDFCVLVDMLLIDWQISSKAVERMKALLLETKSNLKKEHIRKAATGLPSGHAARKLIADTSIEAFLTNKHLGSGNDTFPFRQEVMDLDGYAADLARAYTEIAKTRHAGRIHFRDLLTGAVFGMYS